jgi:hypothetical protein
MKKMQMISSKQFKEIHYKHMAEKREKKPLIMRKDVFQKLKDLHYFSKK